LMQLIRSKALNFLQSALPLGIACLTSSSSSRLLNLSSFAQK
jgi:hypothetical protein